MNECTALVRKDHFQTIEGIQAGRHARLAISYIAEMFKFMAFGRWYEADLCRRLAAQSAAWAGVWGVTDRWKRHDRYRAYVVRYCLSRYR
jgi:hypothetical protein